MEEAILYRIIENKLNEMKGLSIQGNIPLSESIINEVLQIFLKNLSSNSNSSTSNDKFLKIFNSLDKKDIYIHLDKKVANIQIELKKV